MADTIWFDGDGLVVAGRLVEDEDGEWAISNDTALPVAGHLARDGDGDFVATPGAGAGLSVNLRFAAPFILIEE